MRLDDEAFPALRFIPYQVWRDPVRWPRTSIQPGTATGLVRHHPGIIHTTRSTLCNATVTDRDMIRDLNTRWYHYTTRTHTTATPYPTHWVGGWGFSRNSLLVPYRDAGRPFDPYPGRVPGARGDARPPTTVKLRICCKGFSCLS